MTPITTRFDEATQQYVASTSDIAGLEASGHTPQQAIQAAEMAIEAWIESHKVYSGAEKDTVGIKTRGELNPF